MSGWSLERLMEITPQEFEILMGYLFRQMGYRAEVTQQSRDGGVDINVSLENFGLSHRWVVQAKRYSGVVGVKEVREYSSLRYRDNVDGVIIVTTASFTKEAHLEASRHNVKLIEGGLLVRMLDHYCPGEGDRMAAPNMENTNNHTIDGAILKRGENTFASEPVIMDKKKLTMAVTNKNIFLKKSSGLLSRNHEIQRKIPVKEIIGIHIESKNIFIVTGTKEIEIIQIRIKNKSRLPAELDKLRADYIRSEHLLKFGWNGECFLVLTNRRLSQVNPLDGAKMEIKIKEIVGLEVSGTGLFKKNKLIISRSRDGIQKNEIYIDDAHEWHKQIEEAVRIA